MVSAPPVPDDPTRPRAFRLKTDRIESGPHSESTIRREEQMHRGTSSYFILFYFLPVPGTRYPGNGILHHAGAGCDHFKHKQMEIYYQPLYYNTGNAGEQGSSGAGEEQAWEGGGGYPVRVETGGLPVTGREKAKGLMGRSNGRKPGVDEIFSRVLLLRISKKNTLSSRRERGSAESVKIGSIDARGIPEISSIIALSHPGFMITCGKHMVGE